MICQFNLHWEVLFKSILVDVPHIRAQLHSFSVYSETSSINSKKLTLIFPLKIFKGDHQDENLIKITSENVNLFT